MFIKTKITNKDEKEEQGIKYIRSDEKQPLPMAGFARVIGINGAG